MIICSCQAITESQYREAVRAIAQGRAVRCDAGDGCGGCFLMLQRIAAEERAKVAGESREANPGRGACSNGARCR